jgi:hypothetical protein
MTIAFTILEEVFMPEEIQRVLLTCLTITAVIILLLCLLVIMGAGVILASTLAGGL